MGARIYPTGEYEKVKTYEQTPQEAEAQLSHDLNGKAIVSMGDGTKIGTVSDLMIDPETLQVAALVISKGSFLRREFEAIPASEVKVWRKDVVLVNRPDAIVHEEDLPDLDKWITVSDRIHGRYVVSVDGTRIGQVNDVVIDIQGKVVA